jgi:hypothetical protein
VVRIGEERKVYRVLVVNLEGKGPLGRPRHRWLDADTNGSWRGLAGRWSGFNWRDLVNAVLNIRVLAPRCKLVTGVGMILCIKFV